MNKEMILGGYYVGVDGIRTQLPIFFHPSASNIKESIMKIVEASQGVVTIRYQQIPETGPYELDVYVDSGNFILMLNEFDEDGENNVRTLNCGNTAESKFVFILGEKYPVQAITRDISHVYLILKEFIQTRNVSTALLG